MASYIKLVASAGSDVLNLLDPPNAFVLDNEFNFQYSREEPVWENFLVFVNKTGTNARQWLATLQRMSRQATHSLTHPIYPANKDIFLEIESDGEATAKYALVTQIAYEIRAENGVSPLLGSGLIVSISVLRFPWFESSSDTTVNDWSLAGSPPTIGQTGSGGYYTAINTQEDARIKVLSLTNGTGTSPTTKMWIGFRDYNYGIVKFEPNFECESGTMGTDTSATADGTASGSSKAQCTFSTVATLAKRVSLRFNDTSPTAHMEMAGRYLLLMRMKLGSSTAVRIVTKDGWQTLGFVDTIAGDTYLSSSDNTNLTNWNLIELGYLQIPSVGYKDDSWIIDYMKYYAIEIYAERLSGSGNLDMDMIILMPADHLAVLDNLNLYSSGSGGGASRIYTSPSGITSVVSLTSGSGLVQSKGSFTNWLIPAAGFLVIAGQEATQHSLGRTVDVVVTATGRFPQYRSG